jgi:uncharacterized protein (DUF2147 family)
MDSLNFNRLEILMMQRFFAGLVFVAAAGSALAQNTPVGKWNTIDDKTKEIKSEVTFTEAGGVVSGKITKLLRKEAKQDAVCNECTDARKGKLVLGMEIARGLKKEAEANVWSGGKILDPETGKEYTLKLTPVEGGKKLEMRATVFGIGPTQTWVRVE